MKKIGLILTIKNFFYSTVSASFSEDTDIKLHFVNSTTREVALDSSLTFICNINREMFFLVQNEVNMVMKPAHGEEITLTTSGRLYDGEPDFYKLTIESPAPGFVQIKITILKGLHNTVHIRY